MDYSSGTTILDKVVRVSVEDENDDSDKHIAGGSSIPFS